MAERLSVFYRDHGNWCVSFDGQELVTFAGPGAQSLAEQEKKELMDLLGLESDGSETRQSAVGESTEQGTTRTSR